MKPQLLGVHIHLGVNEALIVSAAQTPSTVRWQKPQLCEGCTNPPLCDSALIPSCEGCTKPSCEGCTRPRL